MCLNRARLIPHDLMEASKQVGYVITEWTKPTSDTAEQETEVDRGQSFAVAT